MAGFASVIYSALGPYLSKIRVSETESTGHRPTHQQTDWDLAKGGVQLIAWNAKFIIVVIFLGAGCYGFEFWMLFLANLLRDCPGLDEKEEAIRTFCLGIRSAHFESTEGIHSNQGFCALSVDVKMTHMKLVFGSSHFSTHQHKSFLFPDFDITLNRHSVPSPNMPNPGLTGLFTALPNFCQSMKERSALVRGQPGSQKSEMKVIVSDLGLRISDFRSGVRGRWSVVCRPHNVHE